MPGISFAPPTRLFVKIHVQNDLVNPSGSGKANYKAQNLYIQYSCNWGSISQLFINWVIEQSFNNNYVYYY